MGALAELRSHPRFQELAQLVAQNPAMLPQILRALAGTNPELLQAIRENHEEFLRMLQEAAGGGRQQDPVAAMLAAAQAAQGGGGAGGGQAPAPRPPTVQLSAADQGALERLANLGFDPRTALEAYLACDRNEELAANYLFENMGD